MPPAICSLIKAISAAVIKIHQNFNGKPGWSTFELSFEPTCFCGQPPMAGSLDQLQLRCRQRGGPRQAGERRHGKTTAVLQGAQPQAQNRGKIGIWSLYAYMIMIMICFIYIYIYINLYI